MTIRPTIIPVIVWAFLLPAIAWSAVIIYGPTTVVPPTQEIGFAEQRTWYHPTTTAIAPVFPTSTTVIIGADSTTSNNTILEVAGSSLFRGGVTTTNLAVSGITSGSCVQTAVGGALVGTGSACGSGSSIAGQNGAWETIYTNTLRPTSTANGIQVTGSSTMDLLRVGGSLNASTTNIDTLTVYTGSTFPANDIVDSEVSNTLTASTFAANPANCSANQYPLGIDATGAVESCTADVDTTIPGQNGAWQTLWTNTLSPTNTSAGIFVTPSSTIQILRTDTLTVATGSTFPASDIVDAEVSNTLTASQFGANPANCTAGNYPLGVDETGAVESCTVAAVDTNTLGQNGAWQALWANTLSPTNTAAGIFVNASSTIAGGFRVDGNATTTGRLVIGASQPTGSFAAGDLWVDSDLTVVSTLNLNGASITNHYGTACTGNQWLQDIADGGAFTCTSLDTSGAWSGTAGSLAANGGNCSAGSYPLGVDALGAVESCTADANTLGQQGSWQALWLNTLAPTNTAAGIFVNASSTIDILRVPGSLNASTTNIGTLTVYTGSTFPANDIVDAEVSNTLTASTLAANPANCSAGNYPLGIDATGAVEDCTADVSGGGGGNGSWQALWANTLSPTNTSAGIFVNASSTIAGNFRVDGNATTTGALRVGRLNFNGEDFTSLLGSGLLNTVGSLTLDRTGDWTGTLDGDNASAFARAGVNGIWQALWANTLSPTNTAAGIYVSAPSSTIDILRVAGSLNASTTNIGTLTIYTGSTFPANDIVDAEVSNTLTASTFAADPANCSAGNYPLGIDATGAVQDCTVAAVDTNTLGQNGAWQALWANTLAPTNTSAGIFSYASSTINGTLRVGNQVTISKPGTANQQTVLTIMQDSAATDQGGSMTADVDFHLWDNNTRLATPQARIGVVGSGTATQNAESGGRLTFWTNIENFAAPVLTERMRIDPNGNVGVNTTNPFYKLHVEGTATSTFHVSGNSRLDGGVTTTGRLVTGSTNPSGNVNAGDAFIGGSVSTTNSISVGVSSDLDDDNIYFDQGLQFIGWDESAGEFDIGNDLSVTGVVLSSGGTQGAPGFSFNGDADSGLFAAGTDNVGITTASVRRWDIDATDMTFNVPARGGNGSTAAPTYGFSGDTDSGMIFSTAGGNAIEMVVDTESLLIVDTTNINFGEVVQGVAGTVALPTYAYTADVNTGMFRFAADVLGFTAGGVHAALFGNGTTTIPTDLKVDGNATTSGYLVVGTANPVGPDLSAGDLWIGGNTTTTGTRISFGGGALDQQLNFDNCNSPINCESLIWDDGGAFGAGNFQFTDDLTVDKTLSIGADSAADDDTLFFDAAGESIIWDDSPGEFDFSDGVNITGNATVTAHLSLAGLTTASAAQTAYVCLNAAGEAIEDSTTCLVSARRFKHDIEPLNGPALDLVQRLQPVTFYYNDTFGGDVNLEAQQIGLIADEVLEVEPRLASVYDDGSPKSVRYENVTAVLIKAMQEQQQQIEELQRQVQVLSTNRCSYE